MLEVEELSTGYGEIEVLHSLSFTGGETEILTILGANGAGKSTLLRCLSGLIPARRGRVRFGGTDITRMAPPQRVKLGLVQVPEGRQILGNLSVLDNLRAGAFLYRRDKAHLSQALERVLELFPILSERQSQLAGSLSGGEQQMLAIGRALMSKPRMLLLDEPSLGLAPIVVRRIFEVIGQLRESGIPILLIEQNAKKALEIADRGIVLRRGSILMSRPAGELLESNELRQAYLGGTV